MTRGKLAQREKLSCGRQSSGHTGLHRTLHATFALAELRI